MNLCSRSLGGGKGHPGGMVWMNGHVKGSSHNVTQAVSAPKHNNPRPYPSLKTPYMGSLRVAGMLAERPRIPPTGLTSLCLPADPIIVF